MDTLRGLVSETIPKELFHYTTMEGLDGILRSHAMWATDSLHLNDTTELVNLLPMARTLFSTYAFPEKSKKISATLLGLLEEEHSTGFLSKEKSEYFLLSFTEKGDDLPQWKVYGDDTHGVCIGFDLTGIRPPLWLDTMVTFARCIYQDSEKESLLHNLIAQFCERDEDISASADDLQKVAYDWALWQINNPTLTRADFKAQYLHRLKATVEYSLTSFRADLVRLSCHFKTSHFESENEWRLVLPHVRGEEFKNTVLKTRNDRPYVDFNFKGYEKLPITSVRLGANADPLRFSEILSKNGYTVEVRKSEIPYRSFRGN